MSDKAIYAVLLAGVLVLGYGMFFMPSAQAYQTASPSQSYGTAAPAAGGKTSLASASIPPECGDINDPKQLQHLSHHPDQFQACYKVVDPVKFKAAAGRDVSVFIAQGGSSGQVSMAGHHG